MSDDQSHLDATRRSVLKYSATTAAAGLVGTGGFGSAASLGDTGGKAVMRVDEFYPGGTFRVTAGPQENVPEAVAESGVFSEFNAYTVEYLNTNEQATLYVAASAEIDRGVVYSLEQEFDVTPPEGNLVTVRFDPATEEEFGLADDDDNEFVEGDDDLFGDVETADGGGKALVFADQFYPGAFVRVVSGSVQEVPDFEAVRGSGVFSEFDTRFGRYLNTGEQVHVFVAQSAEVEKGEVYQVEDEFDVTAPEGNLVTVSLVGVDEETLPAGLLDGGGDAGGGGGNQTAGNQTAGNRTPGNQTADNQTAGNATDR